MPLAWDSPWTLFLVCESGLVPETTKGRHDLPRDLRSQLEARSWCPVAQGCSLGLLRGSSVSAVIAGVVSLLGPPFSVGSCSRIGCPVPSVLAGWNPINTAGPRWLALSLGQPGLGSATSASSSGPGSVP